MLNKKYKNICNFLLFALCFVAVERLTHKATRGFTLPNIYSNEPIELYTRGELPKLDQSFRFLGCGLEFYAFVSEDGKLILKLFKLHHVRQAELLSRFLPFCKKLYTQKKERLTSTLASCRLAFEELQNETGLLYLHLGQTDGELPRIVLIDKLGIEHSVRLDEVSFLIQKRASLLIPTLEGPFAKESLSSLLHLIERRCEKGIADRDPVLCQNFGFVENEAIVIDIGSFSKNPFLQQPSHCKRTLFYETLPLRCLLQKQFPHLTPHFEEEFERMIEHE
jgi:hypothetical protein